MALTVVVGLGRSGVGAARLLHHQGESVVVIEKGESVSLRSQAESLRQQGIQVELGRPLELSSFEPWRDTLRTVVISPGIPWDHPTLDALRQEGVRIRGEMDLAWSALQDIPWIGITGTNGKTTVTLLLSHLLQVAGLQAPMGGNMGASAAEMALQISSGHQQADWLVMELSSYQIEAAPEISPQIGLWTTLTPDHLERHGSLDAYRSIKRHLLERSELAIFNADDPDLRAQRPSWDRGVWVSAEGARPDGQPADLWIDDDGQVRDDSGPMFPAGVLAMPGAHNRQNLLMATAAARLIGISAAQIAEGLRSFPGVPHRLERLGCMASGTTVYNDSKATNYAAAEVGLKALQGPVVVLAGGQTKRGDADGWLSQLKSQACSVVLYGSGAEELMTLLSNSGYGGELHCCGDLSDAVRLAADASHRFEANGLILSPACASFDQYRDFEARGDHFRQLMEPLLKRP